MSQYGMKIGHKLIIRFPVEFHKRSDSQLHSCDFGLGHFDIPVNNYFIVKTITFSCYTRLD